MVKIACPPQTLPPKGNSRLERRPLKKLFLPLKEIAVAEGKLWKLRGPTGCESLIKSRELLSKDSNRPIIEHQVVAYERQYEFVG